MGTSTPGAVTGMFPVEAAPSRPQDVAWGKAWGIFCSGVGTTPSGCPAVCSWLWHCFYTASSLQSLSLEKKRAKAVWFIFARGKSLFLPPLKWIYFFFFSFFTKLNVLLRVYLGLLFYVHFLSIERPIFVLAQADRYLRWFKMLSKERNVSFPFLKPVVSSLSSSTNQSAYLFEELCNIFTERGGPTSFPQGFYL